MRRIHEAAEAVETFSPAEERFNRRRQAFGLVAGPLLFVAILLMPAPGLSPPAHRLAAALVGPALAVLLGVGTAATVFAPFADPIIFLFIGSFILAEAMFVHRLDRRLAFSALASKHVGASGLRLAAVYALVTCVLSMWMSNTATTAMMFPLGLAVLTELGRERKNDRAFQQYAMAMMLGTSFAASIGGLGTPVGTPPNLIGVAHLRETAGIDLSFAGWMSIGVPIAIVMMLFVIAWLLIPRARAIRLSPDAVRAVAAELERLGKVSVGERNVTIAFLFTVFLWVLPGILSLWLGQTHPATRRYNALVPESIAAVVGALMLFLMPISWRSRKFTMSWEEASRIDWGIILLFGGGLAMGKLAESTGLSAAMGHWVADKFPGMGSAGLTLVFTALAVVMSETASNTASANIVVPTAIAVARAAGVSPLEPALGATLGASMGFMMPISTPPNAIVYSSGYIPIGTMMRHGIVLDIAGYFVIVAAVLGLSWLVV
jgi:sodium-dependent dicarboxylate transporter 2/3/5